MYQITTALTKLLQLTKRLKCVCGGTSASKTFSIIMILIDKAQTNKNFKIDVISESFPHLEGGAIADFKKIMIAQNYWKDDRWNETKHFYTFETGTVIQFISVDNIGKAHGPRRDILFINEGQNIPWLIVEQLMQRTSGDIWIDWNPTTEFWYYTEIKGKMEHDFITLTYLDNEGLPETVKEFIESRKDNKSWWQVYGLGQLGEVEGRVFKDWAIIDELPHEARLTKRGLDFGYTNDPTAIVDIYEYNGGIILDELMYQTGQSNKAIGDFLLGQEKILTVADSSEPKSIDELTGYGVNIIGATKGPGSVLQGIQLIQEMRVSVTKRSINIIKEYRNYMFKTDKNGKILNEPEDKYNHTMDAIRYGVSYMVPASFFKARTPQGLKFLNKQEKVIHTRYD